MRTQSLDRLAGVEQSTKSIVVDLGSAVALTLLVLVPLCWPHLRLAREVALWKRPAEQWRRLAPLAGTTATLAICSAAASVAIAVPLAIFAFRQSKGTAAAARFFLTTGCFVPLVLVAGGWDGCFGPSGLVPASGWSRPGWPAMLWAILIHAAHGAPLAAVLIGNGLRSRACLAESDAACCAPMSAVVWHGSLPACRSALVLAAVLAAAPPLVDMTVTDLFRIRSLAEEVFTEIESMKSTAATASAAALWAVATTCLVARRLQQPAGMLDAAVDAGDKALMPTLAKSAALWAAFPLAFLSLSAAGTVRQLGLVGADDGSTTWSSATAFNSLAREFERDIPVIAGNIGWAFVAAVAATSGGLAIAWSCLSRRRMRRATFLAMLTLYLTPGPVLAISLLEIWNLDEPTGILAWAYQTPAVLLAGWAIRLLPLCWICCSLGLETARPHLEAAALEGASGTSLLCFAANLAWRWLVLAAAVGTATAFAELPLAHLLSPPGFDAMGVRMFQLLHTSSANQSAALALAMAFTAGALSAFVYLTAAAIGRRVVQS